jgi:hypothetical protein
VVKSPWRRSPPGHAPPRSAKAHAELLCEKSRLLEGDEVVALL